MLMSSGHDLTETGLNRDDKLMSSLFPFLIEVAVSVLSTGVLHLLWTTVFNTPARIKALVEREIITEFFDFHSSNVSIEMKTNPCGAQRFHCRSEFSDKLLK